MDLQLVAAHKAYLKAYKELNKVKFHESYTKYVTANKEKIKELIPLLSLMTCIRTRL